MPILQKRNFKDAFEKEIYDDVDHKQEMNERDWRIFRENNQIIIRG